MPRKITLPLSGEELEVLASIHQGQNDPVYAIVSRVDPDGGTVIADEDEIAAAQDSIDDVLDDPEIFSFDDDSMKILRRLSRLFQRLLNPEVPREGSDGFISKATRARQLIEEALEHIEEAESLMDVYERWSRGKQFTKPRRALRDLLVDVKRMR